MSHHLEPQRQLPDAEQAAPASPPIAGLVDLIAAGTPAPGPGPVPLIGICIDDRHPSLHGRVLVRMHLAGHEREAWLATLANLPVRREDRVLVIQPANWPEGLVVGVVDGMHPRRAPAQAAAVVTLKADEALEIRDAQGAMLLAIEPGPTGPVLRLGKRDQRIDVDGTLAIAADTIAFTRRSGMTLQAGGDVVVTGEQITLN